MSEFCRLTMQSVCTRLWNLSNSCIAGKSSETNQNGMTRFWSSTATLQGQGGKVLHKQTQLLLHRQMKVMRIAFLLDQQEEIVLKERELQMLPHPAQQLMCFNAFTTTGRSANRKKMSKWFRSLLGKMRNSAFKGNI